MYLCIVKNPTNMKLEFRRLSEACIQGEFFHQCRDREIPCYLEYKYGNCRFDAVIYNKQTREVLAIVEIKSYRDKDKPLNVNTKQLRKYSKHGLPLYCVKRIEEVPKCVDALEKRFKVTGLI